MLLGRKCWEKHGYFGNSPTKKYKIKKYNICNKKKEWNWNWNYLLVNCGEDLGNWGLFFLHLQIPFLLFYFCWVQRSFHWSTYGTDPPFSSYPKCHGWVSRLILHLLGKSGWPPPGKSGSRPISAKVRIREAPPQWNRGVFCRRQTPWPEKNLHKIWG